MSKSFEELNRSSALLPVRCTRPNTLFTSIVDFFKDDTDLYGHMICNGCKKEYDVKIEIPLAEFDIGSIFKKIHGLHDCKNGKIGISEVQYFYHKNDNNKSKGD